MTPAQHGEEEADDAADPGTGASRRRTCLKCRGAFVISKPHMQSEGGA